MKTKTENIASQKGDCIGALKGNQETCFNEVARRFYLTTSINWFEDKDNIQHHHKRRNESVETQLYWHLDSSMEEDDNTTTDRNAFTNLSIMNKLAQPLLLLAYYQVIFLGFLTKHQGYA